MASTPATFLLTDEIAGRIADAAAAMARSDVDGFQIDLVPLRRLRRWCSGALATRQDPSARYLLFFLSVFLEDVFYNLVGDVPYTPEIAAERRRFFSGLADSLRELSHSVAAGTVHHQTAPAHELLVDDYIETLWRIERLLGPGNATQPEEGP